MIYRTYIFYNTKDKPWGWGESSNSEVKIKWQNNEFRTAGMAAENQVRPRHTQKKVKLKTWQDTIEETQDWMSKLYFVLDLKTKMNVKTVNRWKSGQMDRRLRARLQTLFPIMFSSKSTGSRTGSTSLLNKERKTNYQKAHTHTQNKEQQ